MKKIIFLCSGIIFPLSTLIAQVIIKGQVKCLNASVNTTKGAENVVVVPTFLPSKSTLTASRPSGYFELNTGLQLAQLQDKQVSLYTISRCTTCKDMVKRVFISEDQDRQNRDGVKSYVTIKDWKLNSNCSQAELTARRADSLIGVISKQPGQDINKVSQSSVLLGTPAFLNFLTNVVNVVGILPNAGTFKVAEMLPGDINYGQFLFASAMSQTANTGFNFSPGRDKSEAVFWNPSAIANSSRASNVSLLSNFKSNLKVGGFTCLTDRFSLGGGVIFTNQDELRSARFRQVGNPVNTVQSDSVILTLKEFAAFISPVYKVNKQLGIGLTLKSIWQNFNNPNQLFISNSRQSTFTDTAIKKQGIDVDISATYKVNPSLQLGLNVMNLAGTELYGDVFIPGQAASFLNQRSFGLGVQYKYSRFNFGADLLFTQDEFYDASLGVNYVPFNNALLSAGVAFKQLSYSFAFRMKHFRIAYINNNGALVNEQRVGKSSILNGRLHGGFVFDFN